MNKKSKSMQRSKRIYGMLLNPDRDDIAATEWLILYIIKNNKKPTQEFINDALRRLQRRIHKNNPKFFLTFPKSNDGHNTTEMSLFQELIRLFEIKIIDIVDIKINHRRQEATPLWGITVKGEKVLKEWWPIIKKYLPSIKLDEKR